MFVSILQRFGFKASQRAGEPLQSRADQNTRKTESGGAPGNEDSAQGRAQGARKDPARGLDGLMPSRRPGPEPLEDDNPMLQESHLVRELEVPRARIPRRISTS